MAASRPLDEVTYLSVAEASHVMRVFAAVSVVTPADEIQPTAHIPAVVAMARASYRAMAATEAAGDPFPG